jgi:hypothetical protein
MALNVKYLSFVCNCTVRVRSDSASAYARGSSNFVVPWVVAGGGSLIFRRSGLRGVLHITVLRTTVLYTGTAPCLCCNIRAPEKCPVPKFVPYLHGGNTNIMPHVVF